MTITSEEIRELCKTNPEDILIPNEEKDAIIADLIARNTILEERNKELEA